MAVSHGSTRRDPSNIRGCCQSSPKRVPCIARHQTPCLVWRGWSSCLYLWIAKDDGNIQSWKRCFFNVNVDSRRGFTAPTESDSSGAYSAGQNHGAKAVSVSSSFNEHRGSRASSATRCASATQETGVFGLQGCCGARRRTTGDGLRHGVRPRFTTQSTATWLPEAALVPTPPQLAFCRLRRTGCSMSIGTYGMGPGGPASHLLDARSCPSLDIPCPPYHSSHR